MALRKAFILVLLLVWSSVVAKRYSESSWRDVYKGLYNKLPKDFPFKQLSYFAGWRLHQGGTYENSLLAGPTLLQYQIYKLLFCRLLSFVTTLLLPAESSSVLQIKDENELIKMERWFLMELKRTLTLSLPFNSLRIFSVLLTLYQMFYTF